VIPPDLRALLKQVSRSFYLSVCILPAPVQSQVGLGYLLARAADTIADTELLPAAERLELLAKLRQAVFERPGGAAIGQALSRRLRAIPALGAAASPSSETRLLARLADCLVCLDALTAADRALVCRVLDQLILGMERDLQRFPAADRPDQAVAPTAVVALLTTAELDQYTYDAAGCVGEFWTDLMAGHFATLRPLAAPALRQRAIALGKALQLVNVIRDVAADLRIGRCYWPADLLQSHGLTAQRLAELVRAPATPTEAAAIQAVTAALLQLARQQCATAWPYVQAIPATDIRLRLACTWPLLLAVDTCRVIEAASTPLLGGAAQRPLKVTRHKVYQRLLESTAAALRDLLPGSAGGGHLDRVFRAGT
jgi:farnesyl-diphosphate farnesyltransferase